MDIITSGWQPVIFSPHESAPDKAPGRRHPYRRPFPAFPRFQKAAVATVVDRPAVGLVCDLYSGDCRDRMAGRDDATRAGYSDSAGFFLGLYRGDRNETAERSIATPSAGFLVSFFRIPARDGCPEQRGYNLSNSPPVLTFIHRFAVTPCIWNTAPYKSVAYYKALFLKRFLCLKYRRSKKIIIEMAVCIVIHSAIHKVIHKNCA